MKKPLLEILVGTLLLGVLGCGNDSASGLDPLQNELVLVQGDGQFAPAGERLPNDLVVAVRSVGTHEARPDVVVEFEVLSGDAALDRRVDVTNELGAAGTGLQLGPNVGTVIVRARVVDVDIAPVEFEAHAVESPELSAVPPQVAAGAVVQLTGTNFNPVPENNVVLFDGVRGSVTTATPQQLSVRVPACLPSREVAVQIRIGSAASGTRVTEVEGNLERLRLEPGEVHDLDATDGSACVTLEAGGLQRYLLVAQSAGRIAGARYNVGLRGLNEGVATGGGASQGDVQIAGRERTTAQRWHEQIREWEHRFASADRAPIPARQSGSVPLEGDRRNFQVIGRGSAFNEVEAVARKVGEHAAIYVDERVADVVDDGFVNLMSDLFDDPIHEVVTRNFGDHSDIDGNDRVIILFTPEVNLLTDRDDDGFVAGFFFGVDLLPGNANSNGGEIFYMVTPDPDGTYSDPRLAQSLVQKLPPILAHEFQHMVHFNERVLIREGRGTDALWLSEGLATMAEDRFALAAKVEGAYDYLGTNLDRAARFLAAPSDISLTVTAGSGTLAERGAGWLFTRYLWEHANDGILAQLTQTTLTGIDNVESTTGDDWEELLADWAVAVQSEFNEWPPLPHPYSYPSIDLKQRLSERSLGAAPLETLENEDFFRLARLWSGGTAFWQLEVEGGRPLAINLGALDGGPVESAAELRLRIVRVF